MAAGNENQKETSEKFRANYDRIFGEKDKEKGAN